MPSYLSRHEIRNIGYLSRWRSMCMIGNRFCVCCSTQPARCRTSLLLVLHYGRQRSSQHYYTPTPDIAHPRRSSPRLPHAPGRMEARKGASVSREDNQTGPIPI